VRSLGMGSRKAQRGSRIHSGMLADTTSMHLAGSQPQCPSVPVLMHRMRPTERPTDLVKDILKGSRPFSCPFGCCSCCSDGKAPKASMCALRVCGGGHWQHCTFSCLRAYEGMCACRRCVHV
jgi:hypothetical protein